MTEYNSVCNQYEEMFGYCAKEREFAADVTVTLAKTTTVEAYNDDDLEDAVDRQHYSITTMLETLVKYINGELEGLRAQCSSKTQRIEELEEMRNDAQDWEVVFNEVCRH